MPANRTPSGPRRTPAEPPNGRRVPAESTNGRRVPSGSPTGRRAPRVPAPWIRTRLRAAPGAAVALALLVALTAALAAAFPRALDRYEDGGLTRAVERATPGRSTLWVTAPVPEGAGSVQELEQALRPGPLSTQYRKILATVRAPLAVDRAESTYGARTFEELEVPDAWLPRPNGLPARVFLVAQAGLAEHGRLQAGRLPRAGGTVTAATAEVEGAVTTETAKVLHVKVGYVLHVPAVQRAPLTVRITGIVEPRTPRGAYWSSDGLLRSPTLKPVPGDGADPMRYWLGTVLLPPDAAPALLGARGAPMRYWQFAPDTEALHGRDVAALKSSVAALEAGPALREIRTAVDPEAGADTDLDRILTSYDGLRSGVAPLVAVAAFGTGTVAAVILAMAGGLAADRRRTELALLRARGASLRGLAGRLFAETAVVAVPAGALGLAAAVLAVPGGRLLPALAAALAVTLVACAALPVRAVAAHRVVRVHTGRQDVTTRRPSRRRTVAELTVLAAAAAAVETLRRQGGDGGQLVAAAPVLVGVIAALVLVRLYPWPLRRLARPAGRLRGLVGPLSLARAGRSSASAVLPLLALLTALTTAAFGGSVLAGVGETRDHAALLAVGADARVEVQTSSFLPAGLAERVRRVPGVRDLTEVSISYQATAADNPASLPVAGVSPAGYAALTTRTGLGPVPAADLRAPQASGAVLPALASPSVARTYGTRPFPVRLDDGSTITVRVTAVRERTPAVPGDNFLVVDRGALTPEAARPAALLLTGDRIDATALERTAGPTASVRLRSAVRAGYVDSPLQSGAERVYGAAVAAGAGYAVLALLLSLLRAAPERTALLARLRTMGLTRAQSRRLLVLESLPQAVLATAGGALTAWAAIRLLSPGIDLTTIALATSPAASATAALHTDALSLAVPATAVLAAAVGVAALQAWWTGRRGAVRELRVGDAR
ncbi:FtsX-like permease family protein [Streptomyces sp. NPDC014805]|uniref:FtsX-like permease family protein n=1 Tax=Streptomyces sp. NPDC014805 TaxID=3364919 RepID=UPI0036F764CA